VTTQHDMIAKKIGEYFGKLGGGESDLVFYDGLDKDENVFITIDAKSYPDKLKTLLQCLAIGDFAILLVTPEDKFDALMGEMIVALELVSPTAIPIVVLSGITKMNEYAIDDVKAKLLAIIKNTSLKDKVTDILVLRDLEEELPAFRQMIVDRASEIPEGKQNVRILIDASFNVKGVGTVILGIVKAGAFNAGEMLELTDPSGQSKNVIVRSIQMQDIDQKSATRGDRVGLAIKGLKPEEIGRDNLLVTKGSMAYYEDITITFRLSKFSKKPISVAEKQMYHIAFEHQMIGAQPVKIEGTAEADVLNPGEEGTVVFKAEKKFALNEDNNWAIVGLLEKWSNRLRIIGAGPATL
jgi:selenocysteine-specific elongation factor